MTGAARTRAALVAFFLVFFALAPSARAQAMLGALVPTTHAPRGGSTVAATGTAAPLPAPDASQSLGAMSVGYPHDGYLINGVTMPKDPRWVVSAPQHAWGTEETIASISHCIERVREQFPATPPVFLGSISPKNGGFAPPHKSHQSGRDADVYFFRQPGAKWFKAATEADLDKPRTWAMLKCFISETDVNFVLIDQHPKAWLEEYALSIGEDPAWINEIFHGVGRYPNPVVQHVPGHVAHMHVRFVSPVARERGVFAYQTLVDQGHIVLRTKELEHEVVKGDSLQKLAAQYNTSVDQLMKDNQLDSDVIKVGQKLKIEQRIDLHAARDSIVIPPRHPPPVAPNTALVNEGKPASAEGSEKAAPGTAHTVLGQDHVASALQSN